MPVMEVSPKFTLRQLELFCAAAEHGSFAAAAEATYLTPNAIAIAVNELESALSTHLCIRQRSKGLTLTPAGQHLQARARQLLSEADDLYWSVGDHAARVRGPITVGCYSTLAATVLPPLMEAMAEHFPEVELSIVDGTVDDLLPMLRNGQIDLLIAYQIALPPDVDVSVLSETEVHVLLGEAHPLATAEAVSLRKLEGEPLILLDLPPSGDHTLEMLGRAGLRPRVAHRSSNFELVRSLVARDFGYSLLIQKPQIDVSYEGRRLVSKPIRPAFSLESVVIAWPAGMRITDRARVLVEQAREAVAGQHWLTAGPQPES